MKINDILDIIYKVQQEVLNECDDFLYEYNCDYHTFDMAIQEFSSKLENTIKDEFNILESESE